MLWLLLISAVLYVVLLGRLSLRVLSIGNDRLSIFREKKLVETAACTLNQKEYPPLSIVVAARNEAVHLKKHLMAILEQFYPTDFEVILLLDRCTDRSAEIAVALATHYPQLRIIEVNEIKAGWAPKKWVLTQGIKVAKHEHLVFTDADCIPAAGWLQRMGARMGEGNSLVFGLGPYLSQSGWLNALIRYETWYTALQYMGRAAMGRPYMAVGRNLAYTKTFFKEAGGFESHRHQMSGDDDLLVNAAGKGNRVGLVLHPEGHVYSVPENTWKDWINQKLRHLSAGSSYRFNSLFNLSLFHGLHTIFYISLVIVLCGTSWTPEALGIYFFRTIIAWVFVFLPAKKWRFNASLGWFPLLDMLYFFYNILLVPVSLVQPPKWKENS